MTLKAGYIVLGIVLFVASCSAALWLINAEDYIVLADVIGVYHLRRTAKDAELSITADHSWTYVSGNARYDGTWDVLESSKYFIRVSLNRFPSSLPGAADEPPYLAYAAPLFVSYRHRTQVCFSEDRDCFVRVSP
jgi:hypothetical protein